MLGKKNKPKSDKGEREAKPGLKTRGHKAEGKNDSPQECSAVERCERSSKTRTARCSLHLTTQRSLMTLARAADMKQWGGREEERVASDKMVTVNIE